MKPGRTAVLSLVLALVLAAVAAAEGPPQAARYVQVITTTVRPSAVPDYEDYVKKIQAGAAKVKASPGQVFVHQVIMGGPGATYQVVLPFEQWGEIDAWSGVPQILTKAYGEAEGNRILKAGRAAVERSQNEVYRLLPELSTRLGAFKGGSFLQLIVNEVEPEMVPQWEEFLAKAKAAAEKEPGGPVALRYVCVQGKFNTYATAFFFDKHGDRDRWPTLRETLTKAYGEEGGRHIDEMRRRSTRSTESFVLALRPDLSRLPPAPAP